VDSAMWGLTICVHNKEKRALFGKLTSLVSFTYFLSVFLQFNIVNNIKKSLFMPVNLSEINLGLACERI
jgi:hypothetical protein